MDTLTLLTALQGLLYAPHANKRAPLDAHYCAAAVHEGGQSVTFRQCGRRPTLRIGGYGWCTQHARRIKERDTV